MEVFEILDQLIALQRIDSGSDELEKLKKNFLKEIETLDANVASTKAQLQDTKKKQDEMAKNRKVLELEIATLDTRIKKYTNQQNDVKSGEQATALGHEIDKAKADKAATEEKVLEFLMGEDDQKVRVQKQTQSSAEEDKQVETTKTELRAKIADCDKGLADKVEDRKKQTPLVEESHLRVYESLRKAGKKIGVALVGDGDTCGGCNMNVAPQILNEMKKNIAVQQCACGRYLYTKG